MRFINSFRQINRVARRYPEIRFAYLRGCWGWVDGTVSYLVNFRFDEPFDTYVTWFIRRAISGEKGTV